MKGNASLLAKVAGLSVAAALLASCYSQIADQNGSFNITARPAPAGSTVVVLVVNSSYENTLKDMLFLIDKGKQFPGSLTGSDLAQLLTDLEQLAAGGLVKFGGYPFYRTTIGASSGSFQIPGVPAGRSYFVKLWALNPGQTFSLNSIKDGSLGSQIANENIVFGSGLGSEQYPNPVQGPLWTPNPGQPVDVLGGQTTTINVTLAPKL
jgi:hypothetical protein